MRLDKPSDTTSQAPDQAPRHRWRRHGTDLAVVGGILLLAALGCWRALASSAPEPQHNQASDAPAGTTLKTLGTGAAAPAVAAWGCIDTSDYTHRIGSTFGTASATVAIRNDDTRPHAYRVAMNADRGGSDIDDLQAFGYVEAGTTVVRQVAFRFRLDSVEPDECIVSGWQSTDQGQQEPSAQWGPVHPWPPTPANDRLPVVRKITCYGEESLGSTNHFAHVELYNPSDQFQSWWINIGNYNQQAGTYDNHDWYERVPLVGPHKVVVLNRVPMLWGDGQCDVIDTGFTTFDGRYIPKWPGDAPKIVDSPPHWRDTPRAN